MEEKEYIAPSNETERKLVEIWEEVLGVEQIGVTDNFFELGGHSIKATRVMFLIKENFDIDINISEILENPCIKILSLEIENFKWIQENAVRDNQKQTKIII